MLFKNAIEIYLNWKETHATYAPKRYAIRLNQLLRFLGEDKVLSEVTGDDIIRFHRSLEASTFNKGEDTLRYSLATVAYSARILKNFFMFWQGRGESNVNHKEILAIRYIKPIKKTLTLDEFNKMSRSLNENFFEDLIKKLAIHMLWDTGMRVSELCDLNISEINPTHPKYGVRTALVRTRKTMRYNLVVWGKETNDLLNKYLGLRLCFENDSDALFVATRREKAGRITTRTLQRWVDDIVERNELDDRITPHSFRHGKAHNILNQPGGNVRDIFALLRHAKPESCFQYLMLNEEQYLQIASKYLPV